MHFCELWLAWGPFKNYVDQFWPNFDPILTQLWPPKLGWVDKCTLHTLLTWPYVNFPPLFVDVVIEWSLGVVRSSVWKNSVPFSKMKIYKKYASNILFMIKSKFEHFFKSMADIMTWVLGVFLLRKEVWILMGLINELPDWSIFCRCVPIGWVSFSKVEWFVFESSDNLFFFLLNPISETRPV